jgi:hypothetical protein
MPITVAARSKAWTVFVFSNSGLVGSNPTQDMNVCVRLFCVVLCGGSGLATDWYSVQGVLPTVFRIKKLKKRPRPNKRLWSHNNNNNNGWKSRHSEDFILFCISISMFGVTNIMQLFWNKTSSPFRNLCSRMVQEIAHISLESHEENDEKCFFVCQCIVRYLRKRKVYCKTCIAFPLHVNKMC